MRPALFVLLAVAACRFTGTYACDQDSQCTRGGAAGRCEATHFCSFSDAACTSGYRYDDSAGSLAKQCVGGPVDAGVDVADAPTDAALAIARVNLGGPMYTGTEYLGTWAADPTAATTCPGASHNTVNVGVNGTVDDPLFQGYAYTIGQTLSCAIANVPAGNIGVRLLFANLFCGCPGGGSCTERFNVKIGGTMVGSVDVVAEGGCAADGSTGTSFAHSYEVAAAGGTVSIDLEPLGGTDAPTVSALEVVPLP